MKGVLLFAIILLPEIFCAQSIAAGAYHSAAVCNDGKVMTWGSNDYGELGDGYSTSNHNDTHSYPRYVSTVNGIHGIISVAAGIYYSMALQNNGSIWTWGLNDHGEQGNGNNVDRNVPDLMMIGARSIAGGDLHCLALKKDSTVWTWGFNDHGQLGNGTTSDSNIPVKVHGMNNAIAVAGGERYSLALKKDGTVWAWGLNDHGQLGNGTNIDSYTPVLVNNLSGITAIAGGSGHSLALTNTGTLYSWGWNYYGQLGNGNNIDSNVPVQINSLTGVTAIASGAYLDLKNDSTVWAWGENNFYQLGNANVSNSNIPTRIDSLSEVIEISGGYFHSMALKVNGALWAWGDNWDGELGNPNYWPNACATPINVLGLCTPFATQVKETRTENNIVNVFPNPSSGIFTVSFKSEITFTRINVCNVLGNCQWSKNFANNKKPTLDLTSLPKGIYFLEAISDGEKSVRKIILE